MPVHDIEAVLKVEEEAISRIKVAKEEAEDAVQSARNEAAAYIDDELKKASVEAAEAVAQATGKAEEQARLIASETVRRVGEIQNAYASRKEEAVAAIIAAVTGGEDVLSG